METLHIKNMVCDRCKLAVEQIFQSHGLVPLKVELGEVAIANHIPLAKKNALAEALRQSGFELLNDKKMVTLEKIKNAIVALVHYSTENGNYKLSDWLSEKLNIDYNSLSQLFSKETGTTIEKYYISQKIERVKEMLQDDQLTLSQIANELEYSSAAYLSNQFKKQTGETPTSYKTTLHNSRLNLDEV